MLDLEIKSLGSIHFLGTSGGSQARSKAQGSGLLEEYREHLLVDRRLMSSTVYEYVNLARRFLAFIGGEDRLVGLRVEHVRRFLAGFKANKTYGNALCALRAFLNYVGYGKLLEGFRWPPKTFRPIFVPSKEELRRFYEALPALDLKALFLFYASTGLRCSEALSLTFQDIYFPWRMVRPNAHSGRTKRSWVTFYNEEAEEDLRRYLASRRDNYAWVFPRSRHYVEHKFKEASRQTGIHVTPQLLRAWFASEMARLGVPDRYVDAFCGRVPQSVLARHYTDYSPQKLREVYEKAALRVLG